MTAEPVTTGVDLPPASDAQGGADMALDRARATELLRDRAFGLTYEQLAERHGYADGSGARQALLRALDRHEAGNVRHLRAIENERYEMDQRDLRAVIADRTLPPTTRIRAIDARTRSAARHARLNGLDAPVQVQISAGARADMDDALSALRETVQGYVLAVSDEPIPDDEPEDAAGADREAANAAGSEES